MNKRQVSDLAVGNFPKYSQPAAHAQIAVDQLFDALNKLNALGFQFYVEAGNPVDPQEYPKMLYRDNPNPELSPIEFQVQSKEEEEKLDSGWRKTPHLEAENSQPPAE
jgi:hypothetical protein